MSVFAVCLSGESAAASVDRLKERYPEPEHYQISERFCLVRSNSISQYVSESVGLGGGGPNAPTGIVFRLTPAYAGFESRSLWEWLQLVESNGSWRRV